MIHLSPNLKKEIYSLYEQGSTYQQLIKRFNLTIWKVREIIRERSWSRTRGTPKGVNHGGGNRKGVSLSEEQKRKIGLENLGKRHNEESRNRMGQGKVGVPRSDEFKEHMRSVLGGKKRDPEIGKNKSEDHRRRRESDTET